MVKHTIYLMMLLLCSSFYPLTQSGQFKTDKGEISFFSETPVENIDAKSSKMYSVIDPSTRKLACIVSISTFEFDNSLMKEHFNEKYLESEKYPKASFSGVINESIDFAKAGVYKVSVTGKLKIHGVEQDRTINGIITIENDKKLSLQSEFHVKLVDHKIEVPTLVFEKIAEVIKVKVSAKYQLN